MQLRPQHWLHVFVTAHKLTLPEPLASAAKRAQRPTLLAQL